MELTQASSLFGMPNDIHLEFEVQQHALAVTKEFFKMPRKDLDALVEVRCYRQLLDHPGLIALNVLFKNGKEDVFLVSEIVVESAAGLACFGGDVLDPGRLKSDAGKNFAGSFHQLLARNERPLLPMR